MSGFSYKMRIGTRKQVYDGSAIRTSGGLHKKDLKLIKGQYVSKKASNSARNRKRKKSKNSRKDKYTVFR